MILAPPPVPPSKVPRLRAACASGLVAWLAVAAPARADHWEEVDEVPAVGGTRNPVGLPPGAEPGWEIGDPWWDDLETGRGQGGGHPDAGVPADPDASGDAGRPNEKMRRRVASQRGRRAMSSLRGELSLIRQACPELEASVRAEILAAGRRAVDEIAAAPFTTPLDHVHAAVAAAIELHAGAGLASARNRELDQRAARRRRAAIAVIVEAIDHSTGLDDRQRHDVSAVLERDWQDSWTLALDHAQRPGRGLPPGVAECVAAALETHAPSAGSGGGSP